MDYREPAKNGKKMEKKDSRIDRGPMTIKLIDLREAAEMLSMSEKTLYKWVGAKKIPHVKMGKALRFNVRKLEEWLSHKEIDEHEAWR